MSLINTARKWLAVLVVIVVLVVVVIAVAAAAAAVVVVVVVNFPSRMTGKSKVVNTSSHKYPIIH
jgi:hypothetical protein